MRRKDAAIGIVPYMQSGEAMPSRHAGMMPIIPSLFSLIRVISPWILSFANTETRDPIAIPITQYQNICLSWMSKSYQM